MLAYCVRFYTPLFEWFPPPPPPYIPNVSFYLGLAMVVGVLGVIVYERFGLYTRRIGLDRQIWPGSLVLATVITYIFIMAILFNYRGISYSRFTVALSMPFTAGLMICSHFFLKKTQLFMINKGIVFYKTVLIGPQWRCREVLQKLQEHHGSQYQILGFISTDKHQHGSTDLPCLGNRNDLENLIQTNAFDHLILAMPTENHEPTLEMMDLCRKYHVSYRVVPDLFDSICQRLSVCEIIEIPTIHFGESNLVGFGLVLKRGLDILVAMTALIVSSPIMLLVALLIKFDTKGPIFYVQERVGNDGTKFKIYKFRSMVDEAEKDSGPRWATANDPRTTLIGRILRKYNLDELPQFFNVLKGDMSIVGPRPERPYFVDRFKEEIPLYMRRHMVKSGITGLAQVNGWRGDTSVVQRTHYDLYYVKNWSLMMDVKIILKTLTSFKNAY